MDYNFNIKVALVKLLPNFLRKDRLQDFLYGITKKMQNLVNDTVLVSNFDQADGSFYQWTLFIQKFMRFNSQTIYLEKYLNDEYDTGAEYPYSSTNNALYIDNTGKAAVYGFNYDEPQGYVFNYNIWTDYRTYNTDDYLLYNNKVYVSLQDNNINKQPGSETDYWVLYTDTIVYTYNEGEDITSVDFTVNVPISVTYDLAKLVAQIMQYKTAGKSFQIIEY